MFVWNFNYSIEALRQAQRNISNTKLFGARCARAFSRFNSLLRRFQPLLQVS